MHAGKFYILYLFRIFYQKLLFQKFFQEYHESVKQFGSRSGPTLCRTDLGPNCFKKLSAGTIADKELKAV